MEQRLEIAARVGDIDSLYTLIMEDAYLLERIDQVPFIDTPLHIAASAGHLHFALEILRLKPSYARKLNQNGYSPIHLALQNVQTQLVRRFLDIDRDLVHVQGREGRTPLHVVAEYGIVDLLAEFLLACPKSILDLTIRKETALHIAVKFNKLESLKILLGWLEHVGKDEILNWSDDEGNTILHLAASMNQIEMVSLFIDRVDVNATNLAFLTSLDMISQNQTQSNDRNHKAMRAMLLRGGALRASSLARVPQLADSLKKKMSWREKWIISDYRKKLYLSNEDRNVILLAAVLFATANYQAALDSPSESPYVDNRYEPYYRGMRYFFYTLINNIAFLASMVEIYLHLPSDCGILRLVLPLVICNYAVIRIDPGAIIIIVAFLFLFYYSKLAVILHRFVPIITRKKSMKIKFSIFKHCSSFHRELKA